MLLKNVKNLFFQGDLKSGQDGLLNKKKLREEKDGRMVWFYQMHGKMSS